MSGLNGGRINIASTSLGAAERCLEVTKEHTKVSIFYKIVKVCDIFT